jgi:hypothetical protein
VVNQSAARYRRGITRDHHATGDEPAIVSCGDEFASRNPPTRRQEIKDRINHAYAEN